MQVYEYRCPDCEHRVISHLRGDRLEADCDYCDPAGPVPRVFKRVFSVSLQRPMQEHFNSTVGKPISDMRQFKRELARKGAEYTERTGIETNYQPVDMGDRKALGVTDDGLPGSR